MSARPGGAIEIVLGGPGAVADLVAGRDERALGLILEAPRLAVLQMTSFGPSARIYDEGGAAMASRIVAQSRGKLSTVALSHGGQRDLLGDIRREGDEVSRIHHATPYDGLDAAVSAFRKARQGAPVARVDEQGRELSLTWTVAPVRGEAVDRGASLLVRFGKVEDRTVVHWSDAAGKVGIHVVLPRNELSSEEASFAGCEATVVDAVYGLMPSPSGDRTVQTLVLEAPTAFVRAFQDGKLPRHGGLDILERMAA